MSTPPLLTNIVGRVGLPRIIFRRLLDRYTEGRERTSRRLRRDRVPSDFSNKASSPRVATEDEKGDIVEEEIGLKFNHALNKIIPSGLSPKDLKKLDANQVTGGGESGQRWPSRPELRRTKIHGKRVANNTNNGRKRERRAPFIKRKKAPSRPGDVVGRAPQDDIILEEIEALAPGGRGMAKQEAKPMAQRSDCPKAVLGHRR
ncbi:hypothetical protein C8R44DRAFT_907566 [Mycena epipterygia]|nr:hypothetical protein C8R44DRAFT_907566 [Mycena epipterygia]